MIIYSVTVKIEKESEENWIKYMRKDHIPNVMATGCFMEYRFSRLMMDDPEGTNYSIQYLCQDMDTLQRYQDQHAPVLQKEHTEKFKDKFVAFRSLLEIVDHNTSTV